MNKILKNLPVRNILIVLQAVVIFILLFRSNDMISAEEHDLKVSQYLKNEQEFKSKINKQGQELTYQKQVIINKDKDLQKLLLENSDLRKLNSQIKFESVTNIKKFDALYSQVDYLTRKIKQISILPDGDTVYIEKTDTIGVPFGTKFNKSDKWFSLTGSVEKQGISMDSLSILNSYVITVGTKRKSLFKPSETYVELFNENPYTRTVSMNNIKVIEKKKWYQKGIVKFGSGFVLGAVTMFLIK